MPKREKMQAYPVAKAVRVVEPRRFLSEDLSLMNQAESLPTLPYRSVSYSPSRRVDMQRSQSATERAKNYVKTGTAEFFGVRADVDPLAKYYQRRLRLASKRCGPLKPECMSEERLQQVDLARSMPQIHDPLARPQGAMRGDSVDTSTASTRKGLYRFPSQSTARKRKDSVAKMTFVGLATMARSASRMRRGTEKHKKPPQYIRSRSFAPASVTEDVDFSVPPTPATAPFEHMEVPFSLSAPLTPAIDYDSSSLVDDVFFDVATPSPTVAAAMRFPTFPKPRLSDLPEEGGIPVVLPAPVPVSSRLYPDIPEVEYKPEPIWRRRDEPDSSRERTWRRRAPEVAAPMAVPRAVPMATEPSVGLQRIWDKVLDKALDNSDRRQLGVGMLGRFLNRKVRRDRINSDVKKQLEDFSDHRPYFTYWVTVVQIVVCIVSIAVYGLAPVGFSQTQKESLVFKPSLAFEPVGYLEPDNLWIGPKSADLIHLGAKYSPCMRKDKPTWDVIYAERAIERGSACCIRNDGSGCIQSTRSECNDVFSIWYTWENGAGPGGRSSGSVCGQDPRHCESPASAGAHAWKDDITAWPICKKVVKPEGTTKGLEHMSCDPIGRPCCIGIKGSCIITTRPYCDFVNGYFHEEATLCSQVSCMDEVCGMISFANPDYPDQFYRLWTSIFLHAGVVHCVLTVILHIFLMRDLEKMAGPVRIGIIYISSGIVGNMASAIFLPDRAEVGPAGSQLGLLGMLFVEVFQSWQLLLHPWIAILKLLLIFLVLIVIGLFPWVDNYAHIFGFAFGLLLSFALLPYVTFGEFDRRRKIATVVVSLLLALGLLAALIVLFYVVPIYDCKGCEYLNCIPWTDTFCKNYEIVISKS
ncbi:PREDICTED: inactive rhomboid protein 2-like isoform X2 [Priapulus caudatus]|uniref:Inactive rhomboid protein 2-like isoform X2 n=1 Tax=Priapulus caudatus TaxID=37621 RepID=A0ABM1EAQ8_PRICU|nr:PREDICTED: inactive rhomboid protein 2-like isoform X2 [Priapulus caudatus]